MKSLTHALSCNSSSISTPQNAITRCLCSSPFIASIISSTLALAPHALADENALFTQHNKRSLERIVVQAQKTSQNLQDVPVAVTALSGQDLVETVSRDVFDLQNYVPAFGAFQNQSVTNSGFSIRGIGTSSQNFGFESSVGLYVDGVYRARQNALINDLVDIESIEVLRGPQGTLFGKNTAAGAMTLTTVAPSHDERDGFAEAIIGNGNLVRLSAGSSFSLIDDVLAMRVSGFSSHSDGFITDERSRQTLNNRNRSAIKAQLLYTTTADISVRLIADYGELDERCCGALTFQNNIQANDIAGKFGTDALLLQPPFNATIYGRDNFYDYKTSLSQTPLSKMKDKGLSVQVDVALNKAWDLVSISAYRAFDSLDTVDTDFSDADLLTATNDAKQQSFSQEIRLHYTSEDVRGLIGVYYYSQNLDLTFDTTTQDDFSAFFNAAAPDLLPLANAINELSAVTSGFIAPAAAPAPSGTAFAHSAYQEQDSIALFSQLDWLLNSDFTLTTGLRYTREEKSIVGAYDEQGPGIDGLTQDPAQWPNVGRAVVGLQNIAAALAADKPLQHSPLTLSHHFNKRVGGIFSWDLQRLCRDLT